MAPLATSMNSATACRAPATIGAARGRCRRCPPAWRRHGPGSGGRAGLQPTGVGRGRHRAAVGRRTATSRRHNRTSWAAGPARRSGGTVWAAPRQTSSPWRYSFKAGVGVRRLDKPRTGAVRRRSRGGSPVHSCHLAQSAKGRVTMASSLTLWINSNVGRAARRPATGDLRHRAGALCRQLPHLRTSSTPSPPSACVEVSSRLRTDRAAGAAVRRRAASTGVQRSAPAPSAASLSRRSGAARPDHAPLPTAGRWRRRAAAA